MYLSKDDVMGCLLHRSVSAKFVLVLYSRFLWCISFSLLRFDKEPTNPTRMASVWETTPYFLDADTVESLEARRKT